MESQRASRRRVVGALLALLGTAQLLTGTLVPAAHAADAEGGTLLGFEGDGNHAVDTEGNLDWATIDPAIALDELVESGGADHDIGLQGSSSEMDPSDFTCQSSEGAISPEKANLLRAYVHPDIDIDAGLLSLGFVRANGGNQGDTHVNFEFNRGDISFTPTLHGACPYLGRQSGDLLFAFDFPGNATDPAAVSVYSWDATPGPNATDKGGDGSWVELTLSDVAAFVTAEANDATITDEVIDGDQQITERAFGEVVLDLVELDEQVRAEYGDDAAILTCPGFGSVSVRSRASGQSFASSLQDFINPVSVDISTCGSIEIKKVDDLGNPMAGIDFHLFGNAAGTGEPVATCTSGADGTCVFTGVTPGDDYYVFEDASTVPAGYTAASNPVAGPIDVASTEEVDLSGTPIVNPRQTGHVEVTKVLAEQDPDGGPAIPVTPDDVSDLAGATFLLYQDAVEADGEYDAGEEVSLWGSDGLAECTLVSGADSCVIGPVGTGDYRITETAVPAGTTKGPDVSVTVTQAHTALAPAPATFTNHVGPLQISLDKDGPAVARVGDRITYTFVVTNTGDTDLVDVELRDPLCDEGTLALSDDGDGDSVLAVDEVWTYSCTRVVTDTDPDPLPNTATVVGADDKGRTTDATDGHQVDIVQLAISPSENRPPTEVLPSVVRRLPATGGPIGALLLIGGLSILSGAGLSRMGSRLRRRAR